MTAELTETMDQDELLSSFKSRYDILIKNNQEMSKQIKDNEVTALKLLGAIETLEYLSGGKSPDESPTAPTETETELE